MSDNLQLGLQLLLIGMTSVFVILSVVVGLGKVIISYTNTLAPQAEVIQRSSRQKTQQISNKHIAVISAVVDLVTDQKGQIKSIDKL